MPAVFFPPFRPFLFQTSPRRVGDDGVAEVRLRPLQRRAPRQEGSQTDAEPKTLHPARGQFFQSFLKKFSVGHWR